MKINIYTDNSYLKPTILSISPKFNFHLFQNVSELVETKIETPNNIFILDFDYSYQNCDILQIAKKLNSMYPLSQIIFIGNLSSYNCDIYNIQHCYFLVRDHLAEKLTSALLKAVRTFANQALTISYKHDYIRIPIDNIKYVERKGIERKTLIYTKNNRSYQCDKRIDDIMLLIPETQFVRCHTSYIVPIRDAVHLQKNQLELLDGSLIPVSRSYYDSVKMIFQ